MSYQAHQPARDGLVPGHGPGSWNPFADGGLSDLTGDQAAGVSFVWGATGLMRAKFPDQDRILQSDVPALVSSIASYVSSSAGWSPSDVQATAQNIFDTVLCPTNISGGEHLKTVKNVGPGYRLNADTLNAAGNAIGQAVFNYRMAKPTGVAGVTNTVGTALAGLFGNPLVVVAFGAGLLVLYKVWKSRRPAPAKAKKRR